MSKVKLHATVKIKKPLPIYGGETLPAGTEIQLTEEWETIPPFARGQVILDARGDRRLALAEDLEYALGAH
ncbi:MAG: hypothetical protein KIT09_32820 [Bryobacteraceae bacterium]|nr:hypothetical protein [Bryobacteraceae bacterium]